MSGYSHITEVVSDIEHRNVDINMKSVSWGISASPANVSHILKTDFALFAATVILF